MSVYKPTNCYPFSGAVDITRTFISFTVNDDGTYDVVRPSSIYATCKLQTSNSQVSGFRLHIYADGEEVFAPADFSPITELPRFEEDPTINSGVSGTYLAIPIIQSGGKGYDDFNGVIKDDENFFDTISCNSWYMNLSENRPLDEPVGFPNIKVDYLIAYRSDFKGFDNSGLWPHFDEYPDHHPEGFEPYGSDFSQVWDGTINGGCVLKDKDIVAVEYKDPNSGELYLVYCYYSAEHRALFAFDKMTTSNLSYEQRFFLYISKGSHCGIYMIYHEQGSGEDTAVMSSQDWGGKFGVMIESIPTFYDSPKAVKDVQFSWSVDLLQGEPGQSVVHGDEVYDSIDLTSDSQSVMQRYYDIKLASGTILGSCAQRLHLRSVDDIGGQRRLPGYGLQAQPVLVGSFCELFHNAEDRLSPSFPIASFDASLGHVYPKEGYLAQETLDNYAGDSYSPLYASFYKYSSNSVDLLSDECVRVCLSTLDGMTLPIVGASPDQVDPQQYLIAGNKIDGVTLVAGDRVLWNTMYQSGQKNGIWVVGSSHSEIFRPADGDKWADYIGKVILVKEGDVMSSRVMESSATGGPYELGSNGLFFREQSPIQLFYSPSGSAGAADENAPYIKPENYLKPPFVLRMVKPQSTATYTDPNTGTTTQVPYTPVYDILGTNPEAIEMPVLDDTLRVLLSFPKAEWEGQYGYRHARIAKVNQHKMNIEIEQRSSKRTAAPDSRKQFVAMYSLRSGVDTSQTHAISASSVQIVYTYTYIYVWATCDDNAQTRAATVAHGAYAGKTLYKDRNNDVWTLFGDEYRALVMFNEQYMTFISPTSALGEDALGTKLHLRAGATAALQDGDKEDLLIHSYDPTFNYITHDSLQEPFSPVKNESEKPATPYKYDIISRFRSSDQNGFCFYPEASAEMGTEDLFFVKLEPGHPVSYGVDLCGRVYSTTVGAWREARWRLDYPDDFTDAQDSGWFSQKGLECRFIGLEPGETYSVTLQTKDDFGRVATARGSVLCEESGDLLDYPGSLRATPDESTQSMFIEYIPEDAEHAEWPECIPEGSYDVYRREYSEFRMEGCPYPGAGAGGSESLWYGAWKPVALNVTESSVRDFNIKQGHSYQYAIFPKNARNVFIPGLEPSGIEAEYKIIESTNVVDPPSEQVYSSEDELDSLLPEGEPFAYSFGYDSSNGCPYLVNPGREGDGSLSPDWEDPRNSDLYYYVGTFYFDGEYYDRWLQKPTGQAPDEFALNTGISLLTNRVIEGPYKRLIANGGNPVYAQWSDWSLVELKELDADSLFPGVAHHPAVKKAYKADLDNVWLFRFDVEEGSQTVNISKGEMTSMGEFPRFYGGALNAESGDISCWLGSEIAKGSRLGYVERRRRAVFAPLSTNEAAAMLADWRKIVKSDNPKLLRDRKGRSWIVQITGGSSATQGTYPGRPTKISFSWKQIGDPGKAAIVYGAGDELDELGKSGVWKPNIIRRTS